MTVVPIRFVWWGSSEEAPIFTYRSTVPVLVIGSTGDSVFSMERDPDSRLRLPLFNLISGNHFAIDVENFLFRPLLCGCETTFGQTYKLGDLIQQAEKTLNRIRELAQT